MKYLRQATSALVFAIASIHAMESDQGKSIYDCCTSHNQDWHNQAVEIFNDEIIQEIRSALAAHDIKSLDRNKIYKQLYKAKHFSKIKTLFKEIQEKVPSNIDCANNESIATNYLAFLTYFQQEETRAIEQDKNARNNAEKENTHYLKPMHFIHWKSEK